MAAGKPAYLWWNGKRMAWDDATVHVTALGWSTVGAIFEGIRAYWNADHEELYIYRLDEHMDRFERSLKLIRLPKAYEMPELKDAIIDLLRANDTREDTYIRPLAYRGGDGRGGFSGIGGTTEILINTHPSASHLMSGQGKSACVSSWTRISDNVMPPRIKNISNYRNGQLANMEAANNGYDTALILNAQGKVAEGGGACVALIRDGVLITPDTTQSILESITRDSIIQLARDELGMQVVERAVDRTELYIADEVFMCGTAFEITPLVSIDKYDIGDGSIGPVTRQLETLLDDTFRGKTGMRPAWRTPVGVARPVAV
ncbi:MAG TPA: branched-chain amino acid transaminase [Thermomicrobiales bacterium]|nr:branched-chain amino acid transaminase [Thermomicrobiales bacterium]